MFSFAFYLFHAVNFAHLIEHRKLKQTILATELQMAYESQRHRAEQRDAE